VTLLPHTAKDPVGKLVEAESAYYKVRDELREAKAQLVDPLKLVLDGIRDLSTEDRFAKVAVVRYRLDALVRELGIAEADEEDDAA
jgi:hypothetical protein